MLRAQYERRGPVPQDVIHAVEFETPPLEAGEALVEVGRAPAPEADDVHGRWGSQATGEEAAWPRTSF